MTRNNHTPTTDDQRSESDTIHVTRRRALQAGAIGTITAATGASALASPTSARSSTEVDGVLADGFSGRDFGAYLGGVAERFSPPITAAPDVYTLTDRMRNEFGNNTDAWVDYGNWLLAEQDVEPIGSATVGVEVELTRLRSATSPESTTTSLNIEYDEFDEEFVDLDWVDEDPEAPDYMITVQNRAAERAADELQTFRRRFIDPEGDHSLPDSGYVSTLAGRYGGSLIVGDQTAHVLGLLLGEFRHELDMSVREINATATQEVI